MKTPLISISLILFLDPSPIFATDGGAHTGGSDNLRMDTNSAWFLGDEPIRYCYELDPHFEVDQVAAETAIEKAFDTWHAYIQKKSIYVDELSRSNGMNFPKKLIRVKCDQAELKFLFGVENPLVANDRKQYENPTAFAQRQSFDPHSGRGRGYVWVSRQGTILPDRNFPDWQHPYTLQSMLTHEWGHIFGNGHVEGTIMTSDMTSLLRSTSQNASKDKQRLTAIDGARELSLCLYGCSDTYNGTIGDPSDFQDLFGRALGKDVQAFVRTFAYSPNVILSVSDEHGQRDFTIAVDANNDTWVVGDAQTFRVSRMIGEKQVAVHKSPLSVSFLGTIADVSEQDTTIMVERNSSNRGTPLRIFLVKNGNRRLLFRSTGDLIKTSG